MTKKIKKKVRGNLVKVVFCLFFAAIGVYLTWLLHAQSTSPFYHEFGSYSLIPATDSTSVAGLKTAQSMGLSFSFSPHLSNNSPTLSQYNNYHFKYVDVSLRNIIYANFCNPGQTYNCTLNQTKLDKIESQARTAVQNAEKDPNVLSYYDLDDYYGDLTPALQVVRRVVNEEASKANVTPKPILCGLGRNLERQATPGGPVLNSSNEIAFFDKAMNNYSPSTCDLPVLYLYVGRYAKPTDTVDYTMSGSLPWMFDRLKQRGWDPSTSFIGIAQMYGSNSSVAVGSTYYSVTPQKTDVTNQVTSFCKYGALAVMGFNWQDSQLKSRYELINSSDLRDGFSAGINACKKFWATSSTQPLPPVSEPNNSTKP